MRSSFSFVDSFFVGVFLIFSSDGAYRGLWLGYR
jgi:hypothetical protein